MTSRRDPNDGRGALAHALEGIAQRSGSLRRQARNVDTDSPHVRSPRIDRSMRMTGRDDQDVAGFEHPRPTLLDAGAAADAERERREAVTGGRTVRALVARRLDAPGEDRCTVLGIVVDAYALGLVMHDMPIIDRRCVIGRRRNKVGQLMATSVDHTKRSMPEGMTTEQIEEPCGASLTGSASSANAVSASAAIMRTPNLKDSSSNDCRRGAATASLQPCS
jgi:hypothetical protein